MDKDYVKPYIYIYFQQSFSYEQAMAILNNGYHTYWNISAENFYKDLIIEKIVFKYVNGLSNQDTPYR
ncbi:hypothetical protein D3C87_1858490 [compost metagenome]